MMINKGYRHLTVWLLGVALLLPAGLGLAADSVARVASVVGDADVRRAASGKVEPLRFKSEIYLDDVVMTDLGSQVKLLLKDASIIKVGPRTEMKIDRLLVGAGEQTNTTINLIKGRLRSIVGRKLGVTSSYEVRTSVAVAGVRGTVFDGVSVPGNGGPATAAFGCREGQVEVRNADPAIPDVVVITPNTFTMVYEGTPPSPPAPLAPGENLEKKVKTKAGKGKSDQKEEGKSGKEGKTGGAGVGKPAEAGDGGKPAESSGESAAAGAGEGAAEGGQPEAGEAVGESLPEEAIPEPELGDESTEGQDLAEEIEPEAVVVEPVTDGAVEDPVSSVTEPTESSSDQLGVVTEPEVEQGVAVPIRIDIPTP